MFELFMEYMDLHQLIIDKKIERALSKSGESYNQLSRDISSLLDRQESIREKLEERGAL